MYGYMSLNWLINYVKDTSGFYSVYKINKIGETIMKIHQFEEIVFWLSFIAFLLAYHSGIAWLATILFVISMINFISAIILAWKYVKGQRRRNNDERKDI